MADTDAPLRITDGSDAYELRLMASYALLVAAVIALLYGVYGIAFRRPAASPAAAEQPRAGGGGSGGGKAHAS